MRMWINKIWARILSMRFTAMDPLCEKYPAISPYANCLCNPLRFSDPTRLDIYELDANGRLKTRYENTDYDQFIITQNNQKIYSQQYKYGTIESYEKLDRDYGAIGYDKYTISNNSAASEIFDFLSENAPSEFSKISYQDNNDTTKGIIATAGLEDTEPGLTMELKKMFKENTFIYDITHNHPSAQKGPSSEDIKFKQLFLQKYQQNNYPKFYLLHSQKGVPKTWLEF